MRVSLKRMRRDIEEIGDPSARLDEIRRTKAGVETKIEEMRHKQAALKPIWTAATGKNLAEGERPYPDYSSRSKILALLTLAAILAIADSFFQFLVNSMTISAIAPLAWALCSPFIAVGIATVAHVVAYLLTEDKLRPKRSERLCKTSAAVLGIVAGVALAIFLVGRTATQSQVPYLISAISISLWVLAETLPLTAGCVSAAAHHAGRGYFIAKEYQRLEDQLSEWQELLNWLNQQEGAPQESTPAARQASAVARIGGTAAALLLSISLLTSMSTGSAFAAGQAPAAPPRPCSIYFDMTPSLEPVAMAEARKRAAENIREFVTAFGCTSVRAGYFADEGAFAPFDEWPVPAPPRSRDCTAVKIEPKNGIDAGKIFDSIKKYEESTAIQNCQNDVKRDQETYGKAIDALVADIRRSLATNNGTRGKCTSIAALIRYLAAGPGITALFTDGAETCEGSPAAAKLSSNATALLVLIPSKGAIRESGPAALKRAEQWQRLAPGLLTIPYNEVVAGRWQQVSAQLEISHQLSEDGQLRTAKLGTLNVPPRK